MPFNPRGGTEMPLATFGSWVTEMAPIELPAGVSPDNQEMTFAPGNAGSRPALQRVLASPFPSGGPNNYIPTVVAAHSYVTPTGIVNNLYFDSNGTLWVENLNSPGVTSMLLQSVPGSFCKFCSAFGRVYIAISDSLHGADIPYQWDGTNLDRVTQDGPGTPPTVTSLALPSVALVATGAGVAQTIVSITSSGFVQNYRPGVGTLSYYTSFTVTLAGGSIVPAVASQVAIAGNTQGGFNHTWFVQSVSGLTFTVGSYSSTLLTGTGGTATPTGAITLQRQGNIVTAKTAAAHQLQVGYQGQIQGVAASAVGGGIASIVLNNEDTPGLATVTTNAAHGLLPYNNVNISGVTGATVGTAITNIAFAGNFVTVTTSAAHGLSIGSEVIIAAITNLTVNGQWPVATIPSTTTFTFPFVSNVTAYTAADTGTVTYLWPLANVNPAENYFEVQTTPSPTTFTVSLSYTDGTWTGGTVTFAWDGIFYVTGVLSTTLFQYQQYGPNSTTTSVGTVTPYGQASPGLHVCQVLFLTRQGAITAPSPPTTFVANGGQYVSVSNIPLAPSNVQARILAFSGAQSNVPGVQPPMFYLPVPANVSGLTVSTATQIDDNTSTTALLDFSDNSLFTGLGISIPGNNLRSQMVLDGALGFGYFETRLTTWGQRNRVLNLLNMGFDGGYVGSLQQPTGWSIGVLSEGTLVNGRNGLGQAYQFTGPMSITQPAFQDVYGVPIATPNTQYTVRAFVSSDSVAPPGTVLFFALIGPSVAFSAQFALGFGAIPTTGAWVEGLLSLPTPATIPPDLVFEISVNTIAVGSITVDEVSLIYTQTPYLDTVAFGSYGNNPEGIDALSGKFGPSDDSRKIMDMAFLRSTLYLLTQDPSGRVHETTGSSITEPAGWVVDETDSNCGALSAFCLTKSQADDSSASGGEEWMAWASESGARIFGGSTAHKISQEIQSAWSGLQQVTSWPQVNMQAALTISAINDPVERVIYFFLPIGAATGPSQVYPLNYRELDTAEAIAASPPFHPSLSGRLVATDNTRKWTHWIRPLNGAARMYRSAGQLTTVFLGGNGQVPGAAAGFGNVYTLNPGLQVDDDYGLMSPWYVTYFFPAHDEEQGLQLGSHRKMLTYLEAFVAWTGQLQIVPMLGSLSNPSQVTCLRTASNPNPTYDVEWTGGSVTAQRMAFKVSVIPQNGSTSCAFSLQKFIPSFRPAARLPVRGTL